MRRDGKKEKILYITAAVLFVVLAAALMALLLQGNGTKEPEEEVTSPTALPTQAPLEGGITIGSKTVDPGVESFDLSGRTLTDADREAIASLSQLTTLSLTNCGITDVSFLSSLTRLRTLYLSGNRITDLTPLTSLTALRTLYLDNNPLTDLTPLTRLTALTTLSMQGVSVADYVLEDLQAAMPQCRIFNDSTVEGARPISLGGVAFTEDVELLDLSNRGISDISKLSYCLKLQELNLSGNPLESLDTLQGLPQLSVLYLSNTGLEDGDLDFLCSFQRLTYLDLTENPSLTAEGLERLKTALPYCEIYHDEVYFTVELGGQVLTSDMQAVDLTGCGLTSVAGLETFLELRRLVLYGNGLTDLSPLSGLTGMEELILGFNNLQDISALSGMTSLRKLDLSHNLVRDIYPLANCMALEELDLSYNSIDYISHLANCTSLRLLDLTGNPALTAEQIDWLQQQLPGCTIVTDVERPEPTTEPTPEAVG